MERYLNKKFPQEIDKLYSCLSECQFESPTGMINVVRVRVNVSEHEGKLLQKVPASVQLGHSIVARKKHEAAIRLDRCIGYKGNSNF